MRARVAWDWLRTGAVREPIAHDLRGQSIAAGFAGCAKFEDQNLDTMRASAD